MPAETAKLLRIHISEADRYQERPLHEVLVEKCREMKIAGATVFPGLEGFGETAGLHGTAPMRHNRPLVVVVVDSAENIARLMLAAEEWIGTGVMAVSEVMALRVERGAQIQA